MRPGEQLPGIRPLAEELVINPNTVAKAYRELEHEGVIELRHGAGAFVSGNARAQKVTDKFRDGQTIVSGAVSGCACSESQMKRYGACTRRSWPV